MSERYFSDRHVSGIITLEPHAAYGKIQKFMTVKCAHCDFNWTVEPGSGRRRGYCMKCQGLLCGNHWCVGLQCTHLEQRLENMEAGRALDYRPIQVSTAGIILGRA